MTISFFSEPELHSTTQLLYENTEKQSDHNSFISQKPIKNPENNINHIHIPTFLFFFFPTPV